MQYQEAKANAISSSGITLRPRNAMCFVALVADQVVLGTSGLGGEVRLCWEDATARSLLAVTGVWQVLEHVVGRVKGFSN